MTHFTQLAAGLSFNKYFNYKHGPHTLERCKDCDNGITYEGCQCRKCNGSGAVRRYLMPATVWARPARPQL